MGESTLDRLIRYQRERYAGSVSTPPNTAPPSSVGCCIDGCLRCSDEFLTETEGGERE